MYFYYQKTMLGAWTPRTSFNKPTIKRSDGTTDLPITQVVELPENLYAATLSELENIFPLE